MTEANQKIAVLHRMVTAKHTCPWGLKSKDLLQRQGFTVEDHLLRTRQATDEFMAEQHVKTTPQAFIDGKRIGGYDALRRHFGLEVHDPKKERYRPVLVVFSVAALLALSVGWTTSAAIDPLLALQRFIALSMCILAMLKLQDVESFSTMFLGYDLLAQRWIPYSYIYPYAELGAGILMFADRWPIVSVPIALVIGSIGAISVFKAVYIDKRELRCACVGGGSNVPLGFVSLTENLMMVAMAVWMILRSYFG